MHQVSVPFSSAASQLGWERALFESAERHGLVELFHCWQTDRPAVILGRSRRASEDVLEEACAADGVPVLSRMSGGGTVVLGPGCLNYVILLSLVSRPELRDVAASFRAILGDIAAAIGCSNLAIDGLTDLVLDGRKVSGNAQRRGWRTLLHHGTLLYGFDARLAGRYLTEPVRQPAYRRARSHVEFLGNLPLSAGTLRARLEGWAKRSGLRVVHAPDRTLVRRAIASRQP
jgi:lipoate-protein ligase A